MRVRRSLVLPRGFFLSHAHSFAGRISGVARRNGASRMDSPGGVSGKAAPPFAQKRGGEGKGVGRCIYSAVAFLLYRQEEGKGGEGRRGRIRGVPEWKTAGETLIISPPPAKAAGQAQFVDAAQNGRPPPPPPSPLLRVLN